MGKDSKASKESKKNKAVNVTNENIKETEEGVNIENIEVVSSQGNQTELTDTLNRIYVELRRLNRNLQKLGSTNNSVLQDSTSTNQMGSGTLMQPNMLQQLQLFLGMMGNSTFDFDKLLEVLTFAQSIDNGKNKKEKK
ncbi:hypothetical protein [Neobacillus niacini]|uniref:hypothetical protein n=1 Tax=Neobacillus niacini TaxID=86668 RepID=UPI0005F0375A|nr:hypothetical protein [Neobacillus niacini]